MAKNNLHIQQLTFDEAQNELFIQEKMLKHARYQLKRLKKLDPRAVIQAEIKEKIYEINLGKIKKRQARQHA